MKFNDPTYQRIRAACCEQHGLGGITGRRGESRDNPDILDEHAAAITAVVILARISETISSPRSTKGGEIPSQPRQSVKSGLSS